MSETSAADVPTDAPAVDPDALARQLPVDVSFEIGRTELRVGELSALQPGYVFPLAAQLEGANVTIRANGQAVGRGEVVAVGELASQVVAGAVGEGVAARVASRDDVAAGLSVGPGDVVLIKGSRGIGLEKVAASMVATDGVDK